MASCTGTSSWKPPAIRIFRTVLWATRYAFADIDHRKRRAPDGGRPVAGDPLGVLRALAAQVYAAGIRRICGSVRVSLSAPDEGERDMGSGLRISPICVNDNIVDVHVTPGKKGERAALRFEPAAPCFAFVNETVTVASGTAPTVRFVENEDPSDSLIVRVRGDVPWENRFGRVTAFRVRDVTRKRSFASHFATPAIALDDSSAIARSYGGHT